MGDGVDEATRTVINELMRQDSRIHFFDHPKHPRRGEEYRHQALQQARGTIVAYICDRDLWMPHHLQTLIEHLQTATLVSTNYYHVRRNRRLMLPYLSLEPRKAAWGILSAGGHRLDFYHTLPYGWRTTPANCNTDQYMWEQIMAQPDCRVETAWLPTLLYFPTMEYSRWAGQPNELIARRAEDLAYWSARLQTPDGLRLAIEQAFVDLVRERNRFRTSWLLLKGRRLPELPGWLRGKIRFWRTGSTEPTAKDNQPPDRIKSDR